MKKYIKLGSAMVLVCLLVNLGAVMCWKVQLRNNLVRLHVVANSDSDYDQSLKLQVRDAVVAYLQYEIADCADQTEAKQRIEANLANIKSLAEETLQRNSHNAPVSVSICQESFSARQYDTFTLPAGVYDSLRIKIGAAEGKNWWCVVFPAFCLPATSEEFGNLAAECGLQDGLVETLQKPQEYKLRFYLLERLGNFENFLFGL